MLIKKQSEKSPEILFYAPQPDIHWYEPWPSLYQCFFTMSDAAFHRLPV